MINEDRVQAGQGFGTHGHRDMEIISYVLDGALGHRDSMGNGSTILPGDVQRLSAGSGMTHSEFNHERAAPTPFLQIWIEPDERGGAPSSAQRHFHAAAKPGPRPLLAAPGGPTTSRSVGACERGAKPKPGPVGPWQIRTAAPRYCAYTARKST